MTAKQILALDIDSKLNLPRELIIKAIQQACESTNTPYDLKALKKLNTLQLLAALEWASN